MSWKMHFMLESRQIFGAVQKTLTFPSGVMVRLRFSSPGTKDFRSCVKIHPNVCECMGVVQPLISAEIPKFHILF